MSNLLMQGMKPTLTYNDADAYLLGQIMICMAQTYSLKAGIKKFDGKG